MFGLRLVTENIFAQMQAKMCEEECWVDMLLSTEYQML